MATTTQEPAQPTSGAAPAMPAAIDPERDIDAKSTAIWLSVCLVFVVVILWVLAQWFAFAVQREQERKIDNAPTTELFERRSAEDHYLKNAGNAEALASTPAANSSDMSLEELDQKIIEVESSIRSSTDTVISNYINK